MASKRSSESSGCSRANWLIGSAPPRGPVRCHASYGPVMRGLPICLGAGRAGARLLRPRGRCAALPPPALRVPAAPRGRPSPSPRALRGGVRLRGSGESSCHTFGVVLIPLDDFLQRVQVPILREIASAFHRGDVQHRHVLAVSADDLLGVLWTAAASGWRLVLPDALEFGLAVALDEFSVYDLSDGRGGAGRLAFVLGRACTLLAVERDVVGNELALTLD